MTIPHIPLGNGVNGTTHYERLSPTVLRLDHTLGPHARRRRAAWRDWLIDVLAMAALLLGAIGSLAVLVGFAVGMFLFIHALAELARRLTGGGVS